MPIRRSKLDHRSLHPKDYLADPYSFGHALNPQLGPKVLNSGTFNELSSHSTALFTHMSKETWV